MATEKAATMANSNRDKHVHGDILLRSPVYHKRCPVIHTGLGVAGGMRAPSLGQNPLNRV